MLPKYLFKGKRLVDGKNILGFYLFLENKSLLAYEEDGFVVMDEVYPESVEIIKINKEVQNEQIN